MKQSKQRVGGVVTGRAPVPVWVIVDFIDLTGINRSSNIHEECDPVNALLSASMSQIVEGRRADTKSSFNRLGKNISYLITNE